MGDKLHHLLCRLGFHSTFVQVDRWGQGTVCLYCDHDVTKGA